MCPFSDTLGVFEIGYPKGGINVAFLRNIRLKIRSLSPDSRPGLFSSIPAGFFGG
jgi:hypothetical protein